MDGRAALAPGTRLTFLNREGHGALVVRDEPPGVAFLIKEPRMASAVEEYLKNLPDGTTVEDAQAVEALERYLKTL